MINKIKKNIFQLYFKEFGSCVYVLKLSKLKQTKSFERTEDKLTQNSIINKKNLSSVLNKTIIIDTSTKENAEELLQNLKELKIKPEQIDIILITHTHFDHIGNINLFENAKVYDEKNIKEFKMKEIEVIKAPGHKEDCICFLYKDILFSGDVIFHNNIIGRTDLPGSSPEEMKKSLEKLSKINYKILCPGHISKK